MSTGSRKCQREAQRPRAGKRAKPNWVKAAPPTGGTSPHPLHTGTKQAQIIAMLREPRGSSISTIAATVGWQQHSVRGFFAAVVKKRFGFDLAYRRDSNGERLYRIEMFYGPHQDPPSNAG